MNGSADGNNNSFNPEGTGRGFGYSKARGGFRGGGAFGGGSGDGPFGGNRNEDMSCFELDKLHIQQIEVSTTEVRLKTKISYFEGVVLNIDS